MQIKAFQYEKQFFSVFMILQFRVYANNFILTFAPFFFKNPVFWVCIYARTVVENVENLSLFWAKNQIKFLNLYN